jgi:peptide deformylase
MMSKIMLNASDVLTHIDNEEDIPYLRTQLFQVNIRLFHTSSYYRTLIQNAVDVLRTYALAQYKDYKDPHGMSGANAGIPWNIIAIVVDRGRPNARCLCMLNPKILDQRDPCVRLSNCGSIRLFSPINVSRYNIIRLGYFTELGEYKEENFTGAVAATIQHEVDHNNGILITDREIK